MNQEHAAAIAAYKQGNFPKALALLLELLKQQETGELWSDWATVQCACEEYAKAEAGFLRALEIDPGNYRARGNLGLLLIGRGDYKSALPLLETALSYLPEAESQQLRAALAAVSERAHTSNSAARANSAAQAKAPLQVLLVHDVMPDHSQSSECRPMRIILAFRKLGYDVTFVVRDENNHSGWEPELKNLGVRFFAGDAERLCSLGREIPPESWSFGRLLETKKFALALLTQNFLRGISIPEHYLDEIRRRSPATRVAIVSDELQGHAAGRKFTRTGEFRHHEIAEDWSQREQEAFQRADLIIVPDEATAEQVRSYNSALHAGILALGCKPSQMARQVGEVAAQALLLDARPIASAPFSINLVEDIYSSLLKTTSGEKRVYARLDFYVQLSEQLLRQQKAHFAREQLRHIFGWLGDSIKFSPALAHPLGLLTRCYSELGEHALAARCAGGARHCFASERAAPFTANQPSAAEQEPPAFVRKKQLQLSLIVPSYNRLPILQKCLVALASQTISPELFEVIVIDDGSSDGTEDFMRKYQPPFHLRYLRQTNSGTGAARRNGVEHASGDYLLLMNDDTICDPTVLEEHLRAHQTYAGNHWAILGAFEYPAEARRRALTHFLRTSSFMFPQVDMAAGCPYPYSHFITCNLSVPREAVIQAGSFDSTYKLSEDTELGIRLFEMGYGVIYHPAAHAWHDHLPYAVANLIRRARVYGADYFYMFRNHPRVTREWAMPIQLEGSGEHDASRIRAYLESNRADVQAAVVALERWDSVDFEPSLANPNQAAHVLSLFQQAVPAIHWFYLFESMLETLVKESHMPQPPPAHPGAQAASVGS